MKRNSSIRHFIDVIGFGTLVGLGVAACNGPAENRAPVFTTGACDFTAGAPVDIHYTSFLAIDVGEFTEMQAGSWTAQIGGGLWNTTCESGDCLAGHIEDFPGEQFTGVVRPTGGVEGGLFEEHFFELCPPSGLVAPGEAWTKNVPAADDVGDDAWDFKRELFVGAVDPDGVATIQFVDQLQQVLENGEEISGGWVDEANGIAHLDVSGDTPIVLDLHVNWVNEDVIGGILDVRGTVLSTDVDVDGPKEPIHPQPQPETPNE